MGLNVTLILHFALAFKFASHVVAETAKCPVVEIAIPVRSTGWLFVNVNVFAALVVPTFCFAKTALAGVNVAGSTPVPDSATVCGLLAALSVKVSVPVRSPEAIGVKVMLTLQLLFAARVAPQVFAEIAKSPLGVMLLISSVAVLVFFSVTVLAGLVVPTASSPKLSEFGDT